MTLEQNLLLLREKAGLSQEKLAEKLGVSRQAVSKWETGQSTPDVDKLMALSRLYGVSVDSLLGLAPLQTIRKRPYCQGAAAILAGGTAVVWGVLFLCALGGVGPLSLGDADALALPAAALSFLSIPLFEAGRARGECAFSPRTFYRTAVWAMALAPSRLAGVWGMAILRRLLPWLNSSGSILAQLVLSAALPMLVYAVVCLGVWMKKK